MKRYIIAALVIVFAGFTLSTGVTQPIQAGETTKVTFITHLKAGLTELDVFVDSKSNPAEVSRVTPNTMALFYGSPVYASATAVAHNPFAKNAIGPFAKGRPLGITLSKFLAAKGSAEITCGPNGGSVNASFEKLVPNAIYTMWYAFVPSPPTKPFTGALDLPLGARDGSQTIFNSDANGNALFQASFKPCLQMTNDQLMAVLAIAWHSDGKTYGSSPGEFGSRSHVQLFAPLPKRAVIN